MDRAIQEDTIVALSTPLGRGAIAVVRLSGPRSKDIVGRMIGKTLDQRLERRALFARIRNGDHGGELVDEVVVTYYRRPRSYTGEDMVEISCHCNPLIIDRIIELAVSHGARMARPGEFTLRAFLNQKLDLSQAEAVAEVIHARTRQSLNQSLRHLTGKLSERIHEIRDEVLGYLALLEINLDFSDEDIEAVSYEVLHKQVEATQSHLEQLLRTYPYGRLLQEGIKLLLLGKPNVGKSSLLNALLGQKRAIVSDVPGTTRDYIEAGLELDGLYVQAVDTAGIRRTGDAVEAIGVQRSLEQLEQADVALVLFSSPEPPDADDEALLDLVRRHRERVRFVLVANKIDLGCEPALLFRLQSTGLPVVQVSALQEQGIDQLRAVTRQQVVDESALESEEVVVTSARHRDALRRAAQALDSALQAIERQDPEEIVAVDLRYALDALGEITGETTTEDVLNHIFAHFCIGK